MPDGATAWKLIKPPGTHTERIAQACDRCRSKKIKCDGARPACSGCASIGFHCKTTDKLSRRAFPRGYTESLEDRVKQLEKENDELQKMIDSKEEQIDLIAKSNELIKLRTVDNLNTNISSIPFNEESIDSNGNDNINIINNNTNSNTNSYDLEAFTMQETESLENDGSFYGASSGKTLGQSFQRKIGISRPPLYILAARLSESAALYKSSLASNTLDYSHKNNNNNKNNNFALYNLKHQNNSSLNLSISNNDNSFIHALPSKVHSDHLVNTFFNEWCFFPIIHYPTFIEIYKGIFNFSNSPPSPNNSKTTSNSDSLNNPDQFFITQLFLILSISSLNMGSEDIYEGHWSKNLDNIIKNPSLGSLQILVLVQILFSISGRYSEMHHYKMIAVGHAYRLGLNKCQKPFKRSYLEKEMRRRIFWSVYSLDIFSSALLGIPRAINDNNLDCAMPSDVEDEYLTNQIVIPVQSSVDIDSSANKSIPNTTSPSYLSLSSPTYSVSSNSSINPTQPDPFCNVNSKVLSTSIKMPAFLAFTKISRILAKVLDTLYNSTCKNSSFKTIRKLNDELEQCINTFPDSLKYSLSPSDSKSKSTTILNGDSSASRDNSFSNDISNNSSSPLALFLHIMYHYTRMLIYRPIISATSLHTDTQEIKLEGTCNNMETNGNRNFGDNNISNDNFNIHNENIENSVNCLVESAKIILNTMTLIRCSNFHWSLPLCKTKLSFTTGVTILYGVLDYSNNKRKSNNDNDNNINNGNTKGNRKNLGNNKELLVEAQTIMGNCLESIYESRGVITSSQYNNLERLCDNLLGITMATHPPTPESEHEDSFGKNDFNRSCSPLNISDYSNNSKEIENNFTNYNSCLNINIRKFGKELDDFEINGGPNKIPCTSVNNVNSRNDENLNLIYNFQNNYKSTQLSSEFSSINGINNDSGSLPFLNIPCLPSRPGSPVSYSIYNPGLSSLSTSNNDNNNNNNNNYNYNKLSTSNNDNNNNNNNNYNYNKLSTSPSSSIYSDSEVSTSSNSFSFSSCESNILSGVNPISLTPDEELENLFGLLNESSGLTNSTYTPLKSINEVI